VGTEHTHHAWLLPNEVTQPLLVVWAGGVDVDAGVRDVGEPASVVAVEVGQHDVTHVGGGAAEALHLPHRGWLQPGQPSGANRAVKCRSCLGWDTIRMPGSRAARLATRVTTSIT
jgi:hypothetical protein